MSDTTSASGTKVLHNRLGRSVANLSVIVLFEPAQPYWFGLAFSMDGLTKSQAQSWPVELRWIKAEGWAATLAQAH